MPVAFIEVAIFVANLAAKYGPGLVVLGENFVKAIQSHAELTEEEKADLVRRVEAVRAKVAAYQPRDV